MNYNVPNLTAKDQRALAELAQDPQPVELISATDGNTFTFWDDGAGLSDSGMVPNGRRAQLIAVAGKRLYVDGELRNAYYTAAKIKPLYKGDPLAEVPVFDAAAKKFSADMQARRTATHAAGAASMIADNSETITKAKAAKAAKKAAADELGAA